MWTAKFIAEMILPSLSVRMDPILFVYAIFLVCQTQGSSAVTPVFVQKGEDVTLNLMKADGLKDFIDIVWKFNQNTILVRFLPGREPSVPLAYSERIEFSVKNYSVKLKNLTEKDSGVYTARVSWSLEERTVAEYNVTVQGPVSPAELKLDSVSNSSDSCNLTVTCSTQDSHISSTFTCDTKTCSQEGGERSEVTTSGASLRVYLVNDSIICNYSNQVSWTKDMKEIQLFCPRHADPDPSRNHIIVVYVIVVVLIFVVILILAVRYCQKRKKNGRLNIENTVYATPQVEATGQPLDDSRSPPSTIYSAVKPPTGSTEPTRRTLPDSLYAQVEKPSRS